MKAVFIDKYGTPEDLRIGQIETPLPLANEVRVKIIAASLNATDFEIVRGDLIVRLSSGLRRPKNPRLGCDFAGIVDKVGKSVSQFKVGDEVYADLMYQPRAYGAFAEYICIPEKSLRIKPPHMTFHQAATYPQAGVLAIQGIRGNIPPKPNQKVLINGAGGGVGTFAIQIAKYYGTEVTAVDHTSKLDFLKSLGADYVIDYTKNDFTKQGIKYDLILDVMAKKSVYAYRRALATKGIYRMVGGSARRIFGTLFFGTISSKLSSKNVGILIGRPNEIADLKLLEELFISNKVKPVIDKIYNLTETSKALRSLLQGQILGKAIISME